MVARSQAEPSLPQRRPMPGPDGVLPRAEVAEVAAPTARLAEVGAASMQPVAGAAAEVCGRVAAVEAPGCS